MSFFVRVLTALTVIAAPTLAGSAPPAQARPSYHLSVPTTFSPNGDGVQDTLRVRYTLPKPTHVRLEVTKPLAQDRFLRAVDLGVQPAGTHTWTWDGRVARGRRLPDGMYWVRLVLPDGSPVATDRVKLDTAFEPSLQTPTYGGARGASARVFPASTVLTDAVELGAYAFEARVASLRLVIRNSAGRVVRDVDVEGNLRNENGYVFGHGRLVRWAARRADRPLPAGRYTAVVIGRDKAGNRGRSDLLRIWVSADELVWREESTTVTPADTAIGPCAYSTANGCGDFPDCGQVVPSALFVGGLSYRSQPCANPDSLQSRAGSSHLLEVPGATGVRGLDAVRVSFMGAATTSGEGDTGTLRVWDDEASSVVVGSSGESAWVEHPSWGEGQSAFQAIQELQRDPAAAWTFSTTGTDAVDVATFTVDARYLAVAD